MYTHFLMCFFACTHVLCFVSTQAALVSIQVILHTFADNGFLLKIKTVNEANFRSSALALLFSFSQSEEKPVIYIQLTYFYLSLYILIYIYTHIRTYILNIKFIKSVLC